MANYSVRRVNESVNYETAKQRIITLLEKCGDANKSSLAYAVWPGAKWRAPQGAAFAVAKTVSRMINEGLISSNHKRGYELNKKYGG